jgi:hypothetical protein
MHQAYGSLEVQIFGELGDESLVEILAGNFSGIHPLTRWLVGHCAARPRHYEVVTSALKGWLRLAGTTHLGLPASQACGALANLIYWRASTTALGGVRTARVFERGDELRASRKPRSTTVAGESRTGA